MMTNGVSVFFVAFCYFLAHIFILQYIFGWAILLTNCSLGYKGESFPSHVNKTDICDWWLGWSDIKPIDQLFVYFVALELWPWSYAWPWPLYVMHLGRHGQLPSLILVTFHMFDSDFNHIFSICLSNALNFHYLKIKFGCPTCTDKTVYCSPAQSCWSLQAPETPAMLLGQGWFENICCVLFWGAGDRKTQ